MPCVGARAISKRPRSVVLRGIESCAIAEAAAPGVSGAKTCAPSEITAVESVAHSHVPSSAPTGCPVAAPAVPTASGVHSPAVTATVADVEVWAAKIEIVAARVSGIDAEVPISSPPIKWAIEICGIDIRAILPVEQDVAQVEISLCPIDAIKVVIVIDTHQIVEVDLVCSLILVVGQVEFVCHLVGEEQGTLPSLHVAHA